MERRRVRIPEAVLEKARKLTTATGERAAQKPQPPAAPNTLRTGPRPSREKILAALRKLHPMD